ncbi:MAG: hypothetical protein Q9163_000073 [Psora crenata]
MVGPHPVAEVLPAAVSILPRATGTLVNSGSTIRDKFFFRSLEQAKPRRILSLRMLCWALKDARPLNVDGSAIELFMYLSRYCIRTSIAERVFREWDGRKGNEPKMLREETVWAGGCVGRIMR